jgi:hypothetical protein
MKMTLAATTFETNRHTLTTVQSHLRRKKE